MEKLILIHNLVDSKKKSEVTSLLEDKFQTYWVKIAEKKDIDKDIKVFLGSFGSGYIYGHGSGVSLAVSLALENEVNIKGIVLHETAFDKIDSNTRSQLEQLRMPVRFVSGGKDKITQENRERIQKFIPKSYFFKIPSLAPSLEEISSKNFARLLHVQLESFHYEWISTDFGLMSYRRYGIPEQENQPLLLFLHEAIGSIAQWQDFPFHLSRELNLPGIAIEFPGYGFSEKEEKMRDENYLHEFAWDYLPSFLKALQIKNPLILLGHSDGGTNALLYSARFPENVHSIITLAAHYTNEPETRAGIQPAIDAYHAGKLKGLEHYHGEKTERLFFAWANTWNLPNFIDWDISKDIEGNAIPALIIQGDNDQYGTDNQVFEIVKLLKNAQPKFIVNCGHAPHLEKQEEVILAIKNFLS